MMRGTSKSARAEREREKRAERLNKRLFNNSLALFIEHKYRAIFDEYNQLYREMKEAHLGRKNLVTSSTFQKWLTENTVPPVPASPATVPPVPTSPATVPPVTTSPASFPDILSQAVEETGVGMEEPQQGPQDIRQQIDDILNEMLGDQDLHNILHEP